jgi:hypothetical protein
MDTTQRIRGGKRQQRSCKSHDNPTISARPLDLFDKAAAKQLNPRKAAQIAWDAGVGGQTHCEVNNK